MDKETLKKIVIDSLVNYYAVGCVNCKAYAVIDEKRDIYMMVSTQKSHRPLLVLMAEIVENRVIILEDQTNKPWEERLLDAGIPENQVVLQLQNM
jgi:hypothetical protein